MKLKIVRSLVLILTLGLGITACGDYQIRLPGGYYLTRVYARAFLISYSGSDGQNTSGEVVVNATVDRYKVLDSLVVGHVSTLDYMSPEEKAASKPGYFIVNTKTHEVKQGLDKKTWLASLQSFGFTGEPDLSKPSRFDKSY